MLISSHSSLNYFIYIVGKNEVSVNNILKQPMALQMPEWLGEMELKMHLEMKEHHYR